MKTVGTKLDNSEYETFDSCCNDVGLTKSEMLRDLIKNLITPEDEQDDKSIPTPTITSIVEDKENTESIDEARITKIIRDDGTEFIPQLENITISV